MAHRAVGIPLALSYVIRYLVDRMGTITPYSTPEPEHLILTGNYMNDTLTVHLRKIDESKYLLVNRGFHWINEFPYNR